MNYSTRSAIESRRLSREHARHNASAVCVLLGLLVVLALAGYGLWKAFS